MYIRAPHVYLVLAEARRGRWIPGPVVTDGCEPPVSRLVELGMGSLQEQPVLGTTVNLN